MRFVDCALWMAVAFFALISLAVLVDLPSALSAEACGARSAGSGCYPWSAEGPVAGEWRYASKEAYAMSGLAVVLLSTLAIGTMVLSRSSRSSLARIIVGAALVTAGILQFWG